MDRLADVLRRKELERQRQLAAKSEISAQPSLALCGIPLKAAEEMQLRHATREYDRHINKRLRLNAAALARARARLFRK
jgi:hypothetical protein